jgi:hypothetical protein
MRIGVRSKIDWGCRAFELSVCEPQLRQISLKVVLRRNAHASRVLRHDRRFPAQLYDNFPTMLTFQYTHFVRTLRPAIARVIGLLLQQFTQAKSPSTLLACDRI